MAEPSKLFLLLNLALAFYLVGVIWAHEVDIFRSWRLVGPSEFHRVQEVHWRKLPYWVFAPLGLAFAGGVALIWVHPAGSPAWGPWGALGFQIASGVLTGLTWGRWQGRLARDPAGPDSPFLRRILATHWVRTLLVSAYGLTLFLWALEVL
jgi:hypothetical protein